MVSGSTGHQIVCINFTNKPSPCHINCHNRIMIWENVTTDNAFGDLLLKVVSGILQSVLGAMWEVCTKELYLFLGSKIILPSFLTGKVINYANSQASNWIAFQLEKKHGEMSVMQLSYMTEKWAVDYWVMQWCYCSKNFIFGGITCMCRACGG